MHLNSNLPALLHKESSITQVKSLRPPKQRVLDHPNKEPSLRLKKSNGTGVCFLLLVKFNLYDQIDLISHHRHCVT